MRIFFWLIAIACGASVFGQKFNNNDYIIEHYNSANALPQNSILNIVEDDNGFIWMSTEFGLCRYDGTDFVKFNRDNLDIIKNSRMAGISRYSEDTLIFLDADHHAYFIIDSHKFQRCKDSLIAAYYFAEYHELAITPAEDPGKRKQRYIVENDNLKYYEDGKFKRNIFIEKKSIIFSIGAFVAVVNSLSNTYDLFLHGEKVAGDKRPSAELLWTSAVKHEYQQSSDGSFVTIENRVYKLFVNNTYEVQHEFLAELPKGVYQGATALESHGDLFVGTKTNGLYIYKRRDYRSLEAVHNNTYALFPVSDSMLYTKYGFINVKADKLVGDDPSAKQPENIYSITRNEQGVIYFVTDNNVFKRAPSLASEKVSLTCLPDDLLAGIQSVSKDTLLLVPRSNKLMYVINEKYCADALGKDLPGAFHNNIYLESKRKLWLSGTDGVICIDLIGKTITRVEHPDLKQARIVYKAGENIYLIGTYGHGAFIMRNGIVKKIPADRNNYLSCTHCFTEDKYGILWISTNNGILRTRVESILQSIDHNFPLYFESHARMSDEVQELNGACTPCVAALNERLYFPSMNGIVEVKPVPYQPTNKPGKIIIDNIYVNNVLYPGEDIKVKSSFKSLRISFSSALMHGSEQAYYYRNLSVDTSWISLKDNDLTFYALPSGLNELELLVLNGLNRGDVSKRKVLIYVQPPFYQTWQFSSGVLLFLVVSFAALYLYRSLRHRRREMNLQRVIREKTRELQRSNEQLMINNSKLNKSYKILKRNNVVRDKLISIVTHEVKSPLRYFQMKLSRIINTPNENIGQINKSLMEVEKASSQTYDIVERISDWVLLYKSGLDTREDKVHIWHIFDLVADHFHMQIEEKKITVSNEIDRSLYISVNETLFLLVINNLVSNAVKFTEQGSIKFTSHVSDDFLFLVISDTGTGMTESQLQQFNDTTMIASKKGTRSEQGLGLALYMISEIIHDMNGEIVLSHNTPTGIVATLKLPVSRLTTPH